jgi:hypothetical protein
MSDIVARLSDASVTARRCRVAAHDRRRPPGPSLHRLTARGYLPPSGPGRAGGPERAEPVKYLEERVLGRVLDRRAAATGEHPRRQREHPILVGLDQGAGRVAITAGGEPSSSRSREP